MATRRLKPLEQGLDALVPYVGEIDAIDQLGEPRVGLRLRHPCMAAMNSRNAATVMSA